MSCYYYDRKQFPAAPVNPPVIPSWQLKSAERSPASSDQKAGGGDSAPAAADDAASPAEANSRDQAIPAQRRIDLEENDANVDGESEPRGAADHGSAESISTVNGHQNGYASVEGDAAPSSIGSSLHDAMLVSPGKLAALNSASQDGKAPIVSGESELDWRRLAERRSLFALSWPLSPLPVWRDRPCVRGTYAEAAIMRSFFRSRAVP